ncbi:MAG: 4Fe-4S ferredoxin, partial [Deltaproteobacteria bacterium]|nr:4Fe-4S ferredoxin [Deltaproteobacteria bacterium]
MSENIYRKLQEHLDSLPVGFPKTKSGVEMAILRKIFEPEEAEMAAKLTLLPETAEAFSRRVGLGSDEAQVRLERMAKKGQIFRIRNETQTVYCASPFVPGIWEYQLTNLD